MVSYSEQWSADIQRQLPYNFVVTVGYVGNNSLHLYTPYNANQLPDSDLAQGSALTATVANPFYGVITNPNSPLSKAKVQQYQLLLPHPQFQNMIAMLQGSGQSSYNALQLSVEHRFSQGLAFLFAYKHSRIMDNLGDYFIYLSPPVFFKVNYFPCFHRSISAQDLPDVIRLSGQYELPFGPGKPFANSGPLSQICGGWTVGSFFTYDNGLPIQVTEPNNTSTFGAGSTMRPNLVPGVPLDPPGGRRIKIGVPVGTASLYFNPAAFAPAAAFQFGNAPRYLEGLRTPGTMNFDMLAAKRFPIAESLALNFRVEFFNAFNRVQFAGPTNTSIGTNITNDPSKISPSFGTIVPTQTNNPRSIQASLRLSF